MCVSSAIEETEEATGIKLTPELPKPPAPPAPPDPTDELKRKRLTARRIAAAAVPGSGRSATVITGGLGVPATRAGNQLTSLIGG